MQSQFARFFPDVRYISFAVKVTAQKSIALVPYSLYLPHYPSQWHTYKHKRMRGKHEA